MNMICVFVALYKKRIAITGIMFAIHKFQLINY